MVEGVHIHCKVQLSISTIQQKSYVAAFFGQRQYIRSLVQILSMLIFILFLCTRHIISRPRTYSKIDLQGFPPISYYFVNIISIIVQKRPENTNFGLSLSILKRVLENGLNNLSFIVYRENTNPEPSKHRSSARGCPTK